MGAAGSKGLLPITPPINNNTELNKLKKSYADCTNNLNQCKNDLKKNQSGKKNIEIALGGAVGVLMLLCGILLYKLSKK